MASILQEFVGLLVGGIQAMATGIAQGANSMVTALFLDSSGTTPVLSTFGGVVAIFGGVALAVGFTYLIFNWIKSIGN